MQTLRVSGDLGMGRADVGELELREVVTIELS